MLLSPRSRDLSHCGDFSWCIALAPVLLLPQRRRTAGSPLSLGMWCFGKVILHIGQRRFSFSLLAEDCYRICPSPCLTQDLLLSFTSITTGASKLWLLLFLSSKKPLWITLRQKINSWLFIMLYLLHILLCNDVGHSSVVLSGYC